MGSRKGAGFRRAGGSDSELRWPQGVSQDRGRPLSGHRGAPHVRYFCVTVTPALVTTDSFPLPVRVAAISSSKTAAWSGLFHHLRPNRANLSIRCTLWVRAVDGILVVERVGEARLAALLEAVLRIGACRHYG